eukprot:280552_1
MKLVILFLLFVVNTSANTLFTTLGANAIEYHIPANMFDLCAKGTTANKNLEITSFDIHCSTSVGGLSTILIYVATHIQQTYDNISDSETEWTLIHNQSVDCSGFGYLTTLTTFNQNSGNVIINNGHCRGFYVTVPNNTVTDNTYYLWNTDVSATYSPGDVYTHDSAIEFKVGINAGYLFQSIDWCRVWNGQIHYNTVHTLSPTGNPTTVPSKHPTNKPTVDPTITPSEHPTNNPTNTPTKHPTIIPTYNPTLFPSVFLTDAPTKFPVLSPTLTPTTTTGESKKKK